MPALFRMSKDGLKEECAGDVQNGGRKQPIVVMHTKSGTQTCETGQSKIRQFDAIVRHLSANEDDSHFTQRNTFNLYLKLSAL